MAIDFFNSRYTSMSVFSTPAPMTGPKPGRRATIHHRVVRNLLASGVNPGSGVACCPVDQILFHNYNSDTMPFPGFFEPLHTKSTLEWALSAIRGEMTCHRLPVTYPISCSIVQDHSTPGIVSLVHR